MPRPKLNEQQIADIILFRAKADGACLIYGNRQPSSRSGHTHVTIGGRAASVHRLLWLVVKGPIADGLHVCHTCDNPRCVNIDHLWLGTQRENSLDMVAKKRQAFMSKTECKSGHPFTAENTWVCSRGHRHCRTCSRIRQRVASGWSYEEAAASGHLPIPQNAPTKRRRWNVSG